MLTTTTSLTTTAPLTRTAAPRSGRAAAAASGPAAGLVGPEVARLWRQYPPRPALVTWPATQLPRDRVAELVTAASQRLDGQRPVRRRRHPGIEQLLDWLEAHDGQTWQQRWLASGADARGNDDWWHPLLSWLGRSQCGVSMSSNLRMCALLLAGTEVIRPGLGWVLTPRAPTKLVAVMQTLRDREAFDELAALCQATPAGRTMKMAALRRAATIMAVKGGGLREITVGDCLELSVEVDGRSIRRNRGMGFYQLLHAMGVFGPDAPSTIRVFGGQGQLTPAQLIDRYGLACRPVRDVLVDYLEERRPALDHTSLQNLAFSLGALFWKDLERHHPGINSLRLDPQVATAWKQRLHGRTVTDPHTRAAMRLPRESALGNLAMVRAFYLDIAQWAMEDPARWGPWAAPCPISQQDLSRTKSIRARKARMDQRTRERLPALPALAAHVHTVRTETAARLHAATATEPGQSFTHRDQSWQRACLTPNTARVWALDPGTGRRRDLTGEEDRAFWTWAAVDTLRHTGIRIEELTELSHHSLIQYTLPGTGQTIPLLQIAPSKNDAERLLVVSPELADVLAEVIRRNRDTSGALPLVASYDPHERVWNPPMPLLFQRRFGIEHRPIPATTIRDWVTGALTGTTITDNAGRALRFTPHDFRRLFITDAILHGMPPHIAQLVAGHRDINTTMGYKAVYPQEAITAHRAFIARRRQLRPGEEYRQPTDAEWEEFIGHFEHRRLALGTCARSYGTSCIHEHACLRCPLLRPDPAQRDRLVEIRDNLIARIAEARDRGWLGEVDGLQVSLDAARDKLDHLQPPQPESHACP